MDPVTTGVSSEFLIILIPLLVGLIDIIRFLLKRLFNQGTLTKDEVMLLNEIKDGQKTILEKGGARFERTLNRLDASVLTESERMWLRELYEMHSVKTEDGIPIWYLPSAMKSDLKCLKEEFSKHIKEEMEMYFLLENLLKVQEKSLDKFDNIEDMLKEIKNKK